MKTICKLFPLISLFFICSCGNKVIPLRQTYQERPYEFSLASSKDEVWTRLIDILTARGLAIKTVDKTSGVITTDYTSFLRSYAFENKEGALTNPIAYVVCSKVRGPFTIGLSLGPTQLTGQWAVVVKQVDNKTLVDINLANAGGKIVMEDSYNHVSSVESHDLVVKSTGVFEKSVEADLK